MPPLRVSLLANYIGQGWTAIMNVVFIPVYIRYLGMESYGLVGTFSIVLGAAVLFDAGMTPTLSREMARFQAGERTGPDAVDLVRSIEIISLAIICGLIGAAFLAAPWVASHGLGANGLDPATLRRALFLMVVAATLRIVEGVYRGALLGLGHHVELNVIAGVAATIRSGGAALSLALIAPRVELFFLWQAAASLLSVVALGLATHRALPHIGRRAQFDRRVVAEVRHFAGGMLVITLLGVALTQADKVVLVRLLPLREFGFYSVAATVTSGIYQLVGPVSQSYYPPLCAAAARGAMAEVARLYHQGAQMVLLVAAPAALTLIFFGKSVLFAWTGDPIFVARIYMLVRLLAVGTLLHTMMFTPYQLQIANGWPALSIRVNMVAVLLFVPALLVLVPRYGVLAAGSVWIALNAASLAYSVRATHRRLLPTEGRRWLLEDIGRPFAYALAAALALLLLPWGAFGRWGEVPMLVVAGGLLFAAALLGSTSPRRMACARLIRS